MSAEFWERAAGIDPMWAVLSDPARRGRRWNSNEFFATGRREISLLMFQLGRLGHTPPSGAALDFGCGLGRVSQALAQHFGRVLGVDVSARMIQLAAFLNRYGTRVSYLLNQRPDLSAIDAASFDLVYSDIVLQHIPPADTRAYITEFVRVLRPEGIVVFQLPAAWRPPQERPTVAIAMPDAAYQAMIAPSGRDLARLEPGVTRDVAVSITNRSTFDWDQQRSGIIRLGNHWLSLDGTMLIQDDGRSEVPSQMKAGAESTLVLPVTAPREPGHYLCEFDLVHEAVCWFGDRGSPTVRLPVVVGEAAVPVSSPLAAHESDALVYPELDELLPPFDSQPDLGEFPMYGIPADEVLTVLREAGADCFHIEPDDRGGPEWAGHRYFAQRIG